MAENTTDVNGVASFAVIDGTYSYGVDKAGYVTKTGNVTIAGNNVTVNVTLESVALPEYTVSIVVKDVDGNPIQNARVVLG